MPEVATASNRLTHEEFGDRLVHALAHCDWAPHPQYSVFTQYDQDYYFKHGEAFRQKYRCMWAVSKVIQPAVILEFGTHAGSSADAYISASPEATYFGIDLFQEGKREDDGSPWVPLAVATALFESRGFENYTFLPADLRSIDPDELPLADLVVVDAAHDYDNELADLRLAISGAPTYIFVDDSEGEEAKEAIAQFLQECGDRVEWTYAIGYIGGGLVIKLR